MNEEQSLSMSKMWKSWRRCSRKWLPAALGVVSLGCNPMETRVGRHVVYHWDPDDQPLCGGTVEYLDRFVDVQLSRFGLPDADAGPAIEYYWTQDDDLARNTCAREAYGCTRLSPSTYSPWPSLVIAEVPTLTHELVHASVSARTGGLPSFVGEGVAARSQSTFIEGGGYGPGGFMTIDEAQLRSWLANPYRLDPDAYIAAGHWWTSLELEYGVAAMSKFIERLDWTASSAEVEQAVQDIFGISLAESATLASTRPIVLMDDATCEMDLPTFTWTGQPLVLERDGATCADDDIINLWTSRVTSLAIVEFPPTGELYSIRVEGQAELVRFRLVPCRGIHEMWEVVDSDPGSEVPGFVLAGRYVASLTGDVQPDGTVILPRVTIDVPD